MPPRESRATGERHRAPRGRGRGSGPGRHPRRRGGARGRRRGARPRRGAAARGTDLPPAPARAPPRASRPARQLATEEPAALRRPRAGGRDGQLRHRGLGRAARARAAPEPRGRAGVVSGRRARPGGRGVRPARGDARLDAAGGRHRRRRHRARQGPARPPRATRARWRAPARSSSPRPRRWSTAARAWSASPRRRRGGRSSGSSAGPGIVSQTLEVMRALWRTPVWTRTGLVRIEGTDGVERAVLARLDRDWRPVAGTERTRRRRHGRPRLRAGSLAGAGRPRGMRARPRRRPRRLGPRGRSRASHGDLGARRVRRGRRRRHRRRRRRGAGRAARGPRAPRSTWGGSTRPGARARAAPALRALRRFARVPADARARPRAAAGPLRAGDGRHDRLPLRGGLGRRGARRHRGRRAPGGGGARGDARRHGTLPGTLLRPHRGGASRPLGRHRLPRRPAACRPGSPPDRCRSPCWPIRSSTPSRRRPSRRCAGEVSVRRRPLRRTATGNRDGSPVETARRLVGL